MSYFKHINITIAVYFSAIAALYFEGLSGIALFILLASMVWLAAHQRKGTDLVRIERHWLFISVFYASVMIASFFIHLPITDDGVWRLSSYAFIALLALFFFLQRGIVLSPLQLMLIVLFSIACALLVFVFEWWHYGNALFLDKNIRLGHHASVNYGGYANFAMGTFIIGLGVLGFARTSVERIMGFALLGLMLLFVLLGRGRTSIWYFVIVVAVLVWHFYPVLSQKIHQNYLRVLMVAAVLSVVSVLMLSFDRITAAYQDIDQMMQDNYDSSLGHRSVMYRIGTEIVLEHPVLGVGLSHFKETKAAYLAQHDFQLSQEATQKIIGYTQIHNQFLMDMILSGVMGLVAIILFLFYPLWIYIWFYRRAGNQHLRLLALSGVLFIGYAVFASLFGTLFSYTYIAIFYMLINGFLIRFLVQHMDDVRN